MRPFLSSEWNYILNITYLVPSSILEPFKPPEVKLELIENQVPLSIVALDFANTRVKGLKVPFFTSFTDVNFRFYVKYKGRRGVVFIREFVNKLLIAKVAKIVYNEPFQSIPIKSNLTISNAIIRRYFGFSINNSINQIYVKAKNNMYLPKKNSKAYHFLQINNGFGRNRNNRTTHFEVKHPLWHIFPVIDYKLDIQFNKVYGKRFGIINNLDPYVILLARGSYVEVYPSRLLTKEDT